MERLGNVLKERRLDQKLTLEDMSAKTKLSVLQLQAIEDGNIAFFKEDLSYLNYFVRYYANALNVNYEEIRDILDEAVNTYTDAINISQIKKQEEINTNVREKTRQGAQRSPGLNRTKPSYRRIDIPTLGLLLLAVLIVGGMVFVGVKWVLPMIGSTDPITPPPIVNPNPEDETETPSEEKPTTPVEPEQAYVLTKINPTTYEIKGWKENESFDFEFQIQNRSWMEFQENNNVLDEPRSTVYESGETIKLTLVAEKAKVLTIRFGYFSGNTITLNGKPVEIDESIKNSITENFTFRFAEGE